MGSKFLSGGDARALLSNALRAFHRRSAEGRLSFFFMDSNQTAGRGHLRVRGSVGRDTALRVEVLSAR
ncbi:unnamed protein product [Lota lota]